MATAPSCPDAMRALMVRSVLILSTPIAKSVAFGLGRDSADASPPPLRGRIKEGGVALPRETSAGDASDNLLGPRDPPPLPAPTRGGGCANAIDSAEMDHPSIAAQA